VDGAATAVEQFTRSCFAEAAAPKPIIDLGATAKPLVELSTKAPLITLNLGANVGTTGAGEHAPPVKLGAVAPAAGAGPVIVSVPGTLYICDDGSAIGVDVETERSAGIAKLALANGETHALAAVSSSFAEKYSDGQITLRLSGGTLHIVQGYNRQFCAEQ
jgi:membrane-bound inhibitor of C-type lysozyme